MNYQKLARLRTIWHVPRQPLAAALVALVIGIAGAGRGEDGAYTYQRRLEPPKVFNTEAELANVRRARALLALIHYKRALGLLDYRTAEEMAELYRAAGLSADEAAGRWAILQHASASGTLERSLAQEIAEVLVQTGKDAEKLLERAQGKVDPTENPWQLFVMWREVEVGGVTLLKDNVDVMHHAANEFADKERSTAQERWRSVGSSMERAYETWRATQPEKMTDSAARQRAERQKEEAKRAYLAAVDDYRKASLEYEGALVAKQKVEFLVAAHERWIAALETMGTAAELLKNTSLLIGDGSAYEVGKAWIDTLKTVNESGLQAMTSGLAGFDKDEVKTFLEHQKQRGRAFGDTDFAQRLMRESAWKRISPAQQETQSALDAIWRFSKRAESVLKKVELGTKIAKTAYDHFEAFWSAYTRERGRRDPVADVQPQRVREGMAYLWGLAALLKQFGQTLGGLEEASISTSAAGKLIELAGEAMTFAGDYIDAFSAYQAIRNQYVALPALEEGASAPGLRARETELVAFGLAVYRDLDGATGFLHVPKNGGGYVVLSEEQFRHALAAASVLTTLTMRNPTQDEFLAICESARPGESASSKVDRVWYLKPDPANVGQWGFTVADVPAVGDSLLKGPSGNRREEADLLAGQYIVLCEIFSTAAGGLTEPVDYQQMVALPALGAFARLTGAQPTPLNPDVQRRFRNYELQYEPQYERLNRLFCDVYRMDLTPRIFGAIMAETKAGPRTTENLSPLERKLLARRNATQNQELCSVQVSGSQEGLDRLKLRITYTPPNFSWATKVTAQLEVQLPGEQAPRRPRLAPYADGDGRTALVAEIANLPVEKLCGSGLACRYKATVAFEIGNTPVTRTAEGQIPLQSAAALAGTTVVPPNFIDDSAQLSAEFASVLYRHPDLRDYASLKLAFQIWPAAQPDRVQTIPVRSGELERQSESILVIRKQVSLADTSKWPPGRYECRFVLELPEMGKRLATETTDFRVFELPKDEPAVTDKTGTDRPTELTDPTPPMRAAAAQAATLHSQAVGLFQLANQQINQAKELMSQASSRLDSLSATIDTLKPRLETAKSKAERATELVRAAEQAARAVPAEAEKAKALAAQACDEAELAKQAQSDFERSQHVGKALAAAEGAGVCQTRALAKLRDAQQAARELAELSEQIGNVNADLHALKTGLAEVKNLIDRAEVKLQDAGSRAARLAEVVAALKTLKTTAAGLLEAGLKQLELFPDDPRVPEYRRTLNGLFGAIVAQADEVAGWPKTLEILSQPAGAELARLQERLAPLVTLVNQLELPSIDYRELAADARSWADVAEVMLPAVAGWGIEARRCAHAAQSATRPPKPKLTDLAGDVQPGSSPPAQSQPAPDLAKLGDDVRPVAPALAAGQPRPPDLSDLGRDVAQVTPPAPPMPVPSQPRPAPPSVPPPRSRPVPPRPQTAQPTTLEPFFAVFELHFSVPPPLAEGETTEQYKQRIRAQRDRLRRKVGLVAFWIEGAGLDYFVRQAQRAGVEEPLAPEKLFQPNGKYHQPVTIYGKQAQGLSVAALYRFVGIARSNEELQNSYGELFRQALKLQDHRMIFAIRDGAGSVGVAYRDADARLEAGPIRPGWPPAALDGESRMLEVLIAIAEGLGEATGEAIGKAIWPF